jgi:EmrB/QacA subfamily drug resistance transporter
MIALPRSTKRWILFSSILASSMAFIDSTALNVALPAIQSDLAADGQQMLWISNAYLLFLASLILVGGSLGDLYGRRRVFMIGIGIFTLASILCGTAGDANMLILWRALQGIGGALMTPGSLALISASFPKERRGAAIGTWSTFSTLTTLAGPMLGGWLASQGLWRAVFLINAPFGALALLALFLYVPESRDEHGIRQLDIPGALLATLGLAGVTYGFTQAPEDGFGDARVLLGLFGGIVCLAAFIFVETQSHHPMVPLRLFGSRTFSGANALTLFLYGALGVFSFFQSLNLVQVQGYRQEIAGFTFLPFGIILALMGRWAGGLVDRVGARLPLIVGPSLAGVGLVLFSLPGLTAGESDYWTAYFPASLVFAFGMGITVAPLTTAVMGAAPQDSAGIASGINNAVARTASVLAIAILGALGLFTFSSSLETRSSELPLTDEARSQLRDEARKLADANAPAGLGAELVISVELAIKLAFVDTFRLVTLIGAGLAFLSAACAALLVEGQKTTQKPILSSE